MAVVDANSGKIVSTAPIGKGVDAAEFDPERGLVYFSSGDGTMTVFHEDTPDKYTLGRKREDAEWSPHHGNRSEDRQSILVRRGVWSAS